MAEKQVEDQQSDKSPDLHIVRPCSDVVTNPSRNEVLNPNVAHDLEILQQHFWNGKHATNIGPQPYSDEEEREVAINYLRNRSTVFEEPFIEVESRATNKKGKQKGFRVHTILALGVGYQIDSSTFFELLFMFIFFSTLFVLLLFSCYLDLAFVPQFFVV